MKKARATNMMAPSIGKPDKNTSKMVRKKVTISKYPPTMRRIIRAFNIRTNDVSYKLQILQSG
jgi:hypothetical protein